MKERPILFSGPMVRAILNGSKTQTRRSVKGNPAEMVRLMHKVAAFDGYDEPTGFYGFCPSPRVISKHIRCPYGQPGDHLWVREAIKQRPMANFLTGEPTNAVVAAYAADDEDVVEKAGFNLAPWWKGKGGLPAIHMPRGVCRLVLIVTDVRVQRLQDISEEDARAEGVEIDTETGAFWGAEGRGVTSGATSRFSSPVSAFADIWRSINGEDSWKADPWVWLSPSLPRRAMQRGRRHDHRIQNPPRRLPL